MSSTIPTNNSHKSKDTRYDTQPNMSAMLSHFNSHSREISKQRYAERYVPALSSKTLVHPQERITPPLNRLGTHMIRYIDPTVRHRPAGMDGVNNTRATGEPLFTEPHRVKYPQNLCFS